MIMAEDHVIQFGEERPGLLASTGKKLGLKVMKQGKNGDRNR